MFLAYTESGILYCYDHYMNFTLGRVAKRCSVALGEYFLELQRAQSTEKRGKSSIKFIYYPIHYQTRTDDGSDYVYLWYTTMLWCVESGGSKKREVCFFPQKEKSFCRVW